MILWWVLCVANSGYLLSVQVTLFLLHLWAMGVSWVVLLCFPDLPSGGFIVCGCLLCVWCVLGFVCFTWVDCIYWMLCLLFLDDYCLWIICLFAL